MLSILFVYKVENTKIANNTLFFNNYPYFCAIKHDSLSEKEKTMDNQPQNNLQIELSDEVAQGIYSNLAVIAHSASEFVIDFVSLLPGAPKAKVKSRIVLTPEHAKRLMHALNDNVKKYESQFGEIRLQQPPGFTAPPIVGPVAMA
jgi:hypothetical protein